MSTKPRVYAQRAAQVLAASAIAGGGILVAAAPASAAAAVTSVAVVNSSSKVVTTGSTIAITGSGFTGMTDNAAPGTCVATPAAGCSTVRFVGMNAAGSAVSATTPTLATKFTVASDTLIYATVPALPVYGVDGAPSVGYGIVAVSVQNGTSVTTPTTFTATTTAATGAGHLIYRHKLTVDVASSTLASAVGGGLLPVPITAPASWATTANSLTNEKITALFTLQPTGGDAAPTVLSSTVTYVSGAIVNVVVPPGMPAGENVAVQLVHDGIVGVADSNSLKYAAVITAINTCTTALNHTTIAAGTLPTNCTGPAAVPAVAATQFHVKLTGKGFTGATAWVFGATTVPTVDACTIVSDTVAFCSVTIGASVPSPAVAAVTFTPADPDGGGTEFSAPSVGLTAGSILIYTSTV